ncbi:MAG: hypothetical protein UW69_C0052G0007 [Microgenomates group bacterium GW2011_GWA2_44_7]|nr:MAG: hypothetical protein UW69_C0052G0007 [Microgenomates group bacterium GW2011_GWA2_44_7]KKT77313.1 MAG: hypothetical protein UW73_C0023G0018 [Microgenomates group bacterium GW2011_GWB1_44_8]
METLILPGFSLKNKDWAEETKIKLSSYLPATVIYWDHWTTGFTESNWIEKEVKKIADTIGNMQVNILAKSIGTAISLQVIKQKPNSVNKLILCGIPTRDLNPGDQIYYVPLKSFPPDQVLCLQNENDNHGSYAEAEKFIHSLNPDLKVISKPRSDHEYPYSDDFISFLKN